MALNNFGDQLIIRIGKACNFRCNFCNVDENEKILKKESLDDMIRNFLYKYKYSKIENGEIMVTISGGEPSIFKKETLFMLKFANSFFLKRDIKPMFDIQTNASEIDRKFAEDLKRNGVGAALVSFHTIDKEIFEKMIGNNFDIYFKKIISGIHNLHEAGIDVYLNVVLNKMNIGNFIGLLEFTIRELPFVHIYNIGFIQPHGLANMNKESLFMQYADAAGIYNRGTYLLKHNKKNVVSHFVGLPPCYFSSIKDSLEVTENKFFRQNNLDSSGKYLINSINDSNKAQTDDCSYCLYNNFCSGIWKEYIGFQKLNPASYVIDFHKEFSKNAFARKLENKTEDLKKLYDGNIRQLIIPSSIGNKEEVIGLLSKASKIGFYKISLLIDSDFDSDEGLFLTGVSNIQADLNQIDIGFLRQALSFSKKNSPQFRIDMDIFIRGSDNRYADKIKELKVLLPSPFLKIFFIDRGCHDVLKYKSLKGEYGKKGSFAVDFGQRSNQEINLE